MAFITRKISSKSVPFQLLGNKKQNLYSSDKKQNTIKDNRVKSRSSRYGRPGNLQKVGHELIEEIRKVIDGKKAQPEMAKFIQSNPPETSSINVQSLCEKCLEINNVPSIFQPAFPCDHWYRETRTCVVDRNIGDTVTFIIRSTSLKNTVSWKQEFYLQGNRAKELEISQDKLPWNIVIGMKGHELRLSPVTEMDVDFNSFSATLSQSSFYKIYFKIRLIPIDLGFVYAGETLTLNIDSFVSLPAEGVSFEWTFEDQRGLPSNMRHSHLGRILSISELRYDQSGIVSCTVFSNRGFQIAKKIFFIREIHRVKRSPQHRSLKLEEEMEQALEDMDLSSATPNNEGIEVGGSDLDDVFLSIQKKKNLKNQFIQAYQRQGSVSSSTISYEDENYRNSQKFNNPASSPTSPELKTISNYHSSHVVYEENPDNNLASVPLTVATPPRNSISIDEFIQNDVLQTSNDLGLPYTTVQLDSNATLTAPFQESDSEMVTDFPEYFPDEQPHVQTNQMDMPEDFEKIQSNFNEFSESAPHHVPQIKPKDFTRLNSKTSKRLYEDTISRMIASCHKDTQCSSHAVCIKGTSDGFCRCQIGFIGYGLLCWEKTRFG